MSLINLEEMLENERKILICEFLGGEVKEAYKFQNTPVNYWLGEVATQWRERHYWKFDSDAGMPVDSLDFKRDWNQIMEIKKVIERTPIENHFVRFTISTNFVRIDNIEIHIFDTEDPIDVVYNCIVKYISWFNRETGKYK